MTESRQPTYLAANGAVLILTGLLVGLAVPAAPFPRLMLTAHIQFVVNGMLSVFAGLVLRTGLSVVGPRAATFVVWAHVAAWLVCVSEIGAAFWGANQALPIAAGQAGAPGAKGWQEAVVIASHVLPSLMFIPAWALLVRGVFRSHDA